jgi:predicted RNase H-like nuclease (RuvC/YqgF family)
MTKDEILQIVKLNAETLKNQSSHLEHWREEVEYKNWKIAQKETEIHELQQKLDKLRKFLINKPTEH